MAQMNDPFEDFRDPLEKLGLSKTLLDEIERAGRWREMLNPLVTEIYASDIVGNLTARHAIEEAERAFAATSMPYSQILANSPQLADHDLLSMSKSAKSALEAAEVALSKSGSWLNGILSAKEYSRIGFDARALSDELDSIIGSRALFDPFDVIRELERTLSHRHIPNRAAKGVGHKAKRPSRRKSKIERDQEENQRLVREAFKEWLPFGKSTLKLIRKNPAFILLILIALVLNVFARRLVDSVADAALEKLGAEERVEVEASHLAAIAIQPVNLRSQVARGKVLAKLQASTIVIPTGNRAQAGSRWWIEVDAPVQMKGTHQRLRGWVAERQFLMFEPTDAKKSVG